MKSDAPIQQAREGLIKAIWKFISDRDYHDERHDWRIVENALAGYVLAVQSSHASQIQVLQKEKEELMRAPTTEANSIADPRGEDRAEVTRKEDESGNC